MRVYFHNKKATNYMLVTIILSLLVFMTTLGAYASTKHKVENLKPYLAECKISLGAASLTDNRMLIDKINDVCYTAKLNDLNDLRRPSDIESFLANRMAQAWDITWEGTHDLFGDDGALRAAGSDCRVLFELNYEQPKYKDTITKSEMQSFLFDTDYPVKKITYNAYLQGKKMNGAWLIMDDIEPGNTYAVSIQNPHAAGWANKWLVGGTFAAGAIVATVATGGAAAAAIVGGGAIGATAGNAFSDFWNNENVKTIIILSRLDHIASNCEYKGVEV